MDKSAIKTYAVEARRKLIEAVRQKAYQLHIFDDGALPPDEAYQYLRADGIFLTPEQNSARLRLCNELDALGHSLDNKAAYQHLMENVACTWFNRLIALRIMEVNDWLPSNIRILSSREPGRIEPDAVREVERLDYLSQTKVAELRADTAVNAAETLYKYTLISQCNALSAILPGMFQRENDYTELLLPDALLAKGGIVNDLVSKIHEDNFNIEKQGQIEIIGWLYQFYISEKKDEVFAGLKKNIKINKDTIPAATQLFTPEWIVKYMVENSLGRLWLDSHPNADLRAKWKYYVDEAEQEPEVAEQLRVLRSQSPVKRPEDIKLIDPCMGSGHILVYAFDVLFQIYQSEGYSEREIPNLILQNNIYGLDIDDRAGQLAYFALMIKARSYNRRFFRQDNIPQPMVYAVPETHSVLMGSSHFFGVSMIEDERDKCKDDLFYLFELFQNGKEYGSAMKIERKIDYKRLKEYIFDNPHGQITFEESRIPEQNELLNRMIKIAAVLSEKYDVVVTNPPYMGASGMGTTLIEYVKKHYPDSKSDMSTIFMEKTLDLCKHHGYMSMINIPVWMFLSTYEKLRVKLLRYKTIVNMLHLGRGVFGSDFGTTSFVFMNSNHLNYMGTYKKLFPKQGAVDSVEQKEKWFLENVSVFFTQQRNFMSVPGTPISYWINNYQVFSFDKISKQYESGGRTKTHDNDKYVRKWWEVNRISKWEPYANGGEFRKWFGNHFDVVDWSKNARNHYTEFGGLYNKKYWNKQGVCWNLITAAINGFRIKPLSLHYSSGSPTIFSIGNTTDVSLLAFLNSKVAISLLQLFNPTINTTVNDVLKLPLCWGPHSELIEKTGMECVEISHTDWDSFEISWDFKTHPLVQYKIMAGFEDGGVGIYSGTIEQAFKWWRQNAERQFNKLKANEEALNRIFIDTYGLQDELTPEVEDKDVTVRKADLGRDIRSFISYAVGCMFGRYSLDEPGLVFAGGKFDIAKYKTFVPEDDNILPIGSADYFDDDIVVRFIEFVRVVYGDNTLGENLSFIADALYPNGNGSPQDRIRRYFLNDFYKDHVKIYQKRPIYWLLDSGKKDGFKALFYLHRYDKYTIARARTDYLHPLQRKYDAEIKRLEMLSGSTEDAREKAAYRKEIDALLAKIDECRVYDQVVSHIAHQQIELDLDDGVKVNYEKFQGVEVPKDNGRSETMDLLGKI